MAVNTVKMELPQSANTFRGPSDAIWGDCPWFDLIERPALGCTFWDDFDRIGGVTAPTAASIQPWGQWVFFSENATDNTVSDDAILGGGAVFNSGTTAHRGIAISPLLASYQFYDGTNLKGKMWFEARVKISSIAASTLDFFVGLMDTLPVASAVPITATGGALATSVGLFGFHARGGSTNPGDFSVAYDSASAASVTYPTGLTKVVNTLTSTAYTAATYVKLGFVFDPFISTGGYSGGTGNAFVRAGSSPATTNQTAGNLYLPFIRFYVNGQYLANFLIKSDITASSFPQTVMGPVVAFKQQSTTASISAAIDWIRVAQLALA